MSGPTKSRSVKVVENASASLKLAGMAQRQAQLGAFMPCDASTKTRALEEVHDDINARTEEGTRGAR
jgi:hypothetical protein